MAGLVALRIAATYAGVGTEVRGNRIRELSPSAEAVGMWTFGSLMRIVDNTTVNDTLETRTPGRALATFGGKSFCSGNLMTGFSIIEPACGDHGGNDNL